MLCNCGYNELHISLKLRLAKAIRKNEMVAFLNELPVYQSVALDDTHNQERIVL